MKHRFLCLSLAFSLALSPALRADAPAATPLSIEETEPQETSLETPPEETLSSSDTPAVEESVAEVSKGSDERKRSRKRQQLRNIGIAVVAVTLAVVAMILVSTNDGHKESSKN